MGTRLRVPTVSKRIKQLKKQKAVTGGSAPALPPGAVPSRIKKTFGASFTDREGSLLRQLSPSKSDSPAAAKRKLSRAKEIQARAKARAGRKKKTISGLARNAAARPESTFRKRTGGQLTEKEGAALRKRGK